MVKILTALLMIFNFSYATIIVGKWNDPITPTTADYVNRIVDTAEEESAKAIILQLDTPGGLETSMREIIKTIQRMDIPFIVYVYPKVQGRHLPVLSSQYRQMWQHWLRQQT